MNDATGLVDRGVGITFVARDSRLTIERGADGKMVRAVAMSIELASFEHIRLPDKRSLKSVTWLLRVVELPIYNEIAEKENAIGYVSHHEERADWDGDSEEACQISVAIETERFSALLSVLMGGHLPDHINVSVMGMQYDGMPDGSGKLWDAVATPYAPVIDINFTVPLIAPMTSGGGNATDSLELNHTFATRGDIFALRRDVVDQMQAYRRMWSRHSTLLICLVIILIVLAIVR